MEQEERRPVHAEEPAKRRPSRRKRKKWKWILAAAALVILAVAAALVLYLVKVDKFEVEGNVQLKDSQVTELLYPEEEDTRLYKVLYAQITGLKKNDAFDSASVKVTGLKSAVITVKESAPAFVVATDVSVYYYNKNGIRLPEPEHVEVAYPKLAGVRIIRSELLRQPVLSPEDAATFEHCLEIFRLASELRLPLDFLSVTDGEFTVSFRKVRVMLGGYEYMREKLHEISYQYDQYEGLKGTLHMEGYDPDERGQSYWFVVDPE